MNSIPLLFSFIFYLTFIIYVFFGIYIISLDLKSRKNRIFFILCLALCIWTFSFSISNSAPDYDTALFWRRVAALGWGTIYSFLLHFFLILTEKSNILSKRWIYLLLYLPAVVNVYVFSLYSDLVKLQHNLIYTPLGWVNISANSFWDWFFNFYYMGFTIASVGLIWYWGKTVLDQSKKKQAKLLVVAFAIALLLGTFTDVISNSYLSVTIPQMGPVIILIPISTILYSIIHYNFMTPIKISQATEEGKILNETVRKKVYQYVSLIFISGSLINFAIRYFVYQDSLEKELIFNFVGILIGVIIIYVQNQNIKEEHQDLILVLFLGATVPYISLRFIDNASITVWAIPSVFIILSVLFNKRSLILILSAFIIVTQILIWYKMPTVMVQVNITDYVIRIGIFGISIFLALFINRIYINRLIENEDHIGIQKMISRISADFVTANESNLKDKINKMLQLSGEYFNVDRTCLLLFSQEKKTMTYSYEWCNEGIKPAIDKFGESPLDAFPWWMEQITKRGLVKDTALLPREALKEKEALEKLGIKSLISIPVKNEGKILGVLGFQTVQDTKIWMEGHQELLKVLANLLTDALLKVNKEKEINYMAYYDTMTGLPNRSLFKNRLIQAIHLAQRTEKFIGVVFMDLDSFKAVNDTMGHEGGDEMLKQLAIRLQGCVRKHDTVSRFGGDEFLIMLTNIDHIDDISMIAENILDCFNLPFSVKGQEFYITTSVGIATYPIDGEEAEDLIKNADLAMYSSKSKGKNQFTLCSPVLKEDVLKKMMLTNSLYRALERDELTLYYQPQLCVATKKIIGLEALLRWNHPKLGMISPVTFIPIAEQTGLINPIGEWVLMTACGQAIVWQELGLPPARMAVNLSVEQIRNPKLVSIVERTLRETGLCPKYLELEITESTAVKEANYIIRVLNELKDLGVSIAIDDFGTEYSSLSRLKMLPIDRIKMDMLFVQGISDNEKDEAIARIIIQLGKNLGLNIIAEGVETEMQMNFLEKQVCDEVQGFYYYKPMPAEEIETILLSKV